MSESVPQHSGGCQCGKVRFRAVGQLGDSSVCYCRMCQKASASQALALVKVGDVQWTRSPPSWFQSSNVVRRAFCSNCGTPLAYEAPDGLALAVLAFDQPDLFPPKLAWGVEGKLPWCDTLPGLPEKHTLDDPNAGWLAEVVSYQHPDKNTDAWVPKASSGGA
ncbi:glutathione-dependent formaldehyde-activating, GFA [Hyaloraphidium curvatum]|nr:glutathione-dependent formaldehyde-activating, GFA [Hyaloraphidium curvatum]